KHFILLARICKLRGFPPPTPSSFLPLVQLSQAEKLLINTYLVFHRSFFQKSASEKEIDKKEYGGERKRRERLGEKEARERRRSRALEHGLRTSGPSAAAARSRLWPLVPGAANPGILRELQPRGSRAPAALPPNFSCSYIPSHLIYSSKKSETEQRHREGVRGGVKPQQSNKSLRAASPARSHNPASGVKEPTSEKAPRNRGRCGSSAPDLSARAAPGAGREASCSPSLQAGSWEPPVPEEYAARLDPAHLGLGGLRVRRVGADEDGESPELTTSRPIPKIPFTSTAPRVETTTLSKIQDKIPAQTKSPEEIDKEKVHLPDSERKMDPAEEDTNVYTEKHSDNLFKRTEVLAAVIAGGVIGFLFAIFLILLLVYRMRKKDEGSYDLGERKPSSAAYQKAPTKEFYA
uniref:Syndecan n=1 Tax=Capra hircus TaxID=9925 RepID=A0A8C2P455_CAPHI